MYLAEDRFPALRDNNRNSHIQDNRRQILSFSSVLKLIPANKSITVRSTTNSTDVSFIINLIRNILFTTLFVRASHRFARKTRNSNKHSPNPKGEGGHGPALYAVETNYHFLLFLTYGQSLPSFISDLIDITAKKMLSMRK